MWRLQECVSWEMIFHTWYMWELRWANVSLQKVSGVGKQTININKQFAIDSPCFNVKLCFVVSGTSKWQLVAVLMCSSVTQQFVFAYHFCRHDHEAIWFLWPAVEGCPDNTRTIDTFCPCVWCQELSPYQNLHCRGKKIVNTFVSLI